MIESTAALEPGFSGGPLLDTNGKLIGLNVAVSGPRADRLAYTIPFTEQVCEVVARLSDEVSGEKDGPSKPPPKQAAMGITVPDRERSIESR